MSDKEIIITSEKKFFSSNHKEILDFKNLIFFCTLRDLQTVYLQTILGPLWLILIPLITSSLYTLIFGLIAKMPTDGDNQFLFFYTGTILFSFFGTNFSRNSNIFNSHATLMKLIYFPRMVLPISTLISNFFSLMISFIFFIFISFFYLEYNFSLSLFFIPLLLIYLSLIGCVIGMIFSCMTYKYKDLSNTTGIFTQLILFMSPVVYPVNSMPDFLKIISLFNPIAYPISFIRDIFYNQTSFDVKYLFINIFIGIILVIFAYFLYNFFSKIFQDVV